MPSSQNKIVVIYKTKYGSSRQYAEWIADHVGAEIFEQSQIKADDLVKYDTIVYGGSLYARGILGINLITENFHKLKDKKIIVFSVGASPPREKAIKDVINSNFTDEMMDIINFFMLRGAFNFNRLGLMDKLLMSLMKLKLKSKKEEELDADSRGLLASYDNPVDFINEKAIIPIVECIKG